jgi:hypothetical protein
VCTSSRARGKKGQVRVPSPESEGRTFPARKGVSAYDGRATAGHGTNVTVDTTDQKLPFMYNIEVGDRASDHWSGARFVENFGTFVHAISEVKTRDETVPQSCVN